MIKKIEIDFQERELDAAQEVALECVLRSTIEVIQNKCFLHPKKVTVDGNVAWLKEKK